ncbi:uncharacterized protein LOC122499959 [Leptopilina heterotoma]|uniref:uncharacterized protein LOC122499959 n=1 Tax=Leptopilina heterotoma TaxID=63436 RepID=UPI001CA93C70|nr:uncharacterized protein LOC122499959 [Leptopilina heterotoma]
MDKSEDFAKAIDSNVGKVNLKAKLEAAKKEKCSLSYRETYTGKLGIFDLQILYKNGNLGIEIESVTIGAKPMAERKTTENLCVILKDLISEWSIQPDHVKAVLTDNAANIVNACKIVFGDNKHIAKKTRLTFVATHLEVGLEMSNRHLQVTRNDDRATEELKAYLQKKECNRNENQCLKLIQEVQTRWNSTFDMLDRLLELSDFIGRVLLKVSREKSTRGKPPMMLTPEEEEIANEIRDILKPMSQVTKEICSEKSVTLSKCIPLISLLQKSINNYKATHPFLFNFKQTLLTNLEKRFRTVENIKVAAMATILDPRFKKLHFQNAVFAANAVGAIKATMRMRHEDDDE